MVLDKLRRTDDDDGASHEWTEKRTYDVPGPRLNPEITVEVCEHCGMSKDSGAALDPSPQYFEEDAKDAERVTDTDRTEECRSGRRTRSSNSPMPPHDQHDDERDESTDHRARPSDGRGPTEATSESQQRVLSILDDAGDTIRERGPEHGAAAQLTHNARVWSAYLGVDLSASEYCLLMAQTKLSRARIGDSEKKDHYEDAIGYVAWAFSMAAEGQ